MNNEPPAGTTITATLCAKTQAITFDSLPSDIVILAKQCLLDWYGVATLGAQEAMVDSLIDEALDREATGSCLLMGRTETLGLIDATLINGTASHALDYDDGNAAGGHLTAPVAAAILTLAQHTRADGKAVIAAFVAGYEFAARVGYLVKPSHYGRGFHATATLGTVGAARACAHLLKLSPEATLNTVGIAATQAAGLVASFGSMCKPLHVGRAASNGVLAARLAQRGYTGNTEILDHPKGFVAAHGDDCNTDKALSTPPGEYFLLDNVFKFHASCAGTHAAIDGIKQLMEAHQFQATDVQSLTIRIGPHLEKVCNIAKPNTGLEIKFSIRMMCALALNGWNTADPSIFTEQTAVNKQLASLQTKILVAFDPELQVVAARLSLALTDGRQFETLCASVRPESTLSKQGERVSQKFLSLVTPSIGVESANLLEKRIDKFEDATSMTELFALSTP